MVCQWYLRSDEIWYKQVFLVYVIHAYLRKSMKYRNKNKSKHHHF